MRAVVAVTLVMVAAACGGADDGPAPAPAPATSTPPAAPSTDAVSAALSPPSTPATSTTTAPPSTPATTVAADVTQPASAVARPQGPIAVDIERNISVDGGLALDVFYPRQSGPWPVAVTVHGGSWVSGDKEDLEGLARALAGAGMVVFNAEYSPLDEGGVFPQMVEEIACAVAHAQATAADYGGAGVTSLVGYSAGAHISSVVALAAGEFDDGCLQPVRDVAGFVGISGPYDSNQFPFLALQFGGLRTEVPDAWAAANPYTYLGRNPAMDVLLLHGLGDVVVDPAFSSDFAAALQAGGYQVAQDAYPGVGHFTIVDVSDNGAATASATADHVWHVAGS